MYIIDMTTIIALFNYYCLVFSPYLFRHYGIVICCINVLLYNYMSVYRIIYSPRLRVSRNNIAYSRRWQIDRTCTILIDGRRSILNFDGHNN